jgi:hypothetical protein
MAKQSVDCFEGEVTVVSRTCYRLTIEGLAPILFNKPPLMNVSKNEKVGQARVNYLEDERLNWRSKLYTDRSGNIIIPGLNFHQGLVSAAKYWGRKIPGEGNKTYSNIIDAAVICRALNFIDEDGSPIPDTSNLISDYGCNCNGTPTKSGCSMVYKVRPCLAPGWQATIEVQVLDSGRLTSNVMRTIFENMATFIGIGDWRPSHGRFRVVSFEEV